MENAAENALCVEYILFPRVSPASAFQGCWFCFAVSRGASFRLYSSPLFAVVAANGSTVLYLPLLRKMGWGTPFPIPKMERSLTLSLLPRQGFCSLPLTQFFSSTGDHNASN